MITVARSPPLAVAVYDAIIVNSIVTLINKILLFMAIQGEFNCNFKNVLQLVSQLLSLHNTEVLTYLKLKYLLSCRTHLLDCTYLWMDIGSMT